MSKQKKPTSKRHVESQRMKSSKGEKTSTNLFSSIEEQYRKVARGEIKESQVVVSPRSAAKARINPPKLATGGGAKEKERAAAIKLANAASALSSFSLMHHNPTNEESLGRDNLDYQAQNLLELVNSSVVSFTDFTEVERNILYRYFYRTNPYVARTVELHTDIPLSKIRIDPPSEVSEILRDFITSFYTQVLRKVDFNLFLREFVLNYMIYGRARAFVDDYYEDGNKIIEDPDHFPSLRYIESDDLDDKLLDIETRYTKDPDSVSVEDRLFYIGQRLSDYYDDDYQGPSNLKVINFWEVENSVENKDIRYEALSLFLSSSLRDLENIYPEVTPELLSELGYSDGMVALLCEGDEDEHTSLSWTDESTFIVDNDHTLGLPFIFSMQRSDGTSLLNRVMDECFGWEASRRAIKLRIKAMGRVGRVIVAEDLDDVQLENLRVEVETMLNDPDYAIVANYNISWDEVIRDFKEDLDSVIESGDPLSETIVTGMGLPDSMVSGDDTYSGSEIKMDIVNTQYRNLKDLVQHVTEEYFFKPIAIRKGFVMVDDWGQHKLIYPKLSFNRVDLRADHIFDLFFQLYQKGSLPVEILYELLNLDPTAVIRNIKNNLATPLDPTYNEIVRDLYDFAKEDLYLNTDFKAKLIKSSGLNIVEPPPNPDEGESSSGSSKGRGRRHHQTQANGEGELHRNPKKLPPRYDLRTLNTQPDEDLDEEDADTDGDVDLQSD